MQWQSGSRRFYHWTDQSAPFQHPTQPLLPGLFIEFLHIACTKPENGSNYTMVMRTGKRILNMSGFSTHMHKFLPFRSGLGMNKATFHEIP